MSYENVVEFSKMYNKSNTSNIFPILFTVKGVIPVQEQIA